MEASMILICITCIVLIVRVSILEVKIKNLEVKYGAGHKTNKKED